MRGLDLVKFFVTKLVWIAGGLAAVAFTARYTLDRFEEAAAGAVDTAIKGAGEALTQAEEELKNQLNLASSPSWVPYALGLGAVVAVALILQE